MIIINGEEKPDAKGMTITDYLKEAGYRPELVAIELNGEILSKEAYERIISDGDKMEIVTFMGGGCI